MGQGQSKPPPQQLLTDTPWRKFRKHGVDHEQSILEDIKKLSPPANPAILIVGPVGAGKSSLINSCLSVSLGRRKTIAKTGSVDTSYTLVFRKYTDYGLLKNFCLMDCMGIEAQYGHGIHPNDIYSLLKGHVKINYKFDSNTPLTTDSPYYEPNPKFEDTTHCVVFVIDVGAMYAGISSEYVKKILWLQDQIKEADVRSVLILTKADNLCENVKEHPENIFRSLAVQTAVNVASYYFSIEKDSIHPLVNYEEVFQLTTEQNIPILLALRQIMEYASDKIEKMCLCQQTANTYLFRDVYQSDGNLPARIKSDANLPARSKSVPDNIKFYEKRDKGLVLILNSTHNREGTEKDVAYLKKFFGDKLHWTVLDPRSKSKRNRDLTIEQIDEQLMEVRNTLDGHLYHCFICVILSHGNEKGIAIEDAYLSAEDIREKFSNKAVPKFVGCPKVFLIQACRGSKIQEGHAAHDHSGGNQFINKQGIVSVPTDADTLMFFSTTPDYVALRFPSYGTLFIQECVDVFEKYYEKEHLEEMLITIKHNISRYEFHGEKQMPCVWSTLTRRLML